MSNFIDTIRQRQEDLRNVQVLGVDPDVQEAGACLISARVPAAGPTSGHLAITSCDLLTIRIKTTEKGHQRSAGAANAIISAIDSAFNLMPKSYLGVVEVPEVYANHHMDWHVLVAKANAVALLSLVAGGVLTVLSAECQAHAVLPRDWKKQATKAATARDGYALLSTHGVVPSVQAWREDRLVDEAVRGGAIEHAEDAMGLALYGLNQIFTGKWGIL
jgi:hypothetical protein